MVTTLVTGSGAIRHKRNAANPISKAKVLLSGLRSLLQRGPAQPGAPVDVNRGIAAERLRAGLLGGLIVAGTVLGGSEMLDNGSGGGDSMPDGDGMDG